MENTGADGEAMQATANTSEPDPRITISRHAALTALRAAEAAADEANNRLRDAEQQRDNLVRDLSVKQQRVDALHRERDFRSRHVRDLFADIS